MTTPTIGIACHSFRTDGGMGRYVQLLAEGLLNLGIHPTVITKKIDYSLPLSKEVREALQKPLLPSRMEQKCSVQFFLTTPGGAVFLPT